MVASCEGIKNYHLLVVLGKVPTPFRAFIDDLFWVIALPFSLFG